MAASASGQGLLRPSPHNTLWAATAYSHMARRRALVTSVLVHAATRPPLPFARPPLPLAMQAPRAIPGVGAVMPKANPMAARLAIPRGVVMCAVRSQGLPGAATAPGDSALAAQHDIACKVQGRREGMAASVQGGGDRASAPTPPRQPLQQKQLSTAAHTDTAPPTRRFRWHRSGDWGLGPVASADALPPINSGGLEEVVTQEGKEAAAPGAATVIREGRERGAGGGSGSRSSMLVHRRSAPAPRTAPAKANASVSQATVSHAASAPTSNSRARGDPTAQQAGPQPQRKKRDSSRSAPSPPLPPAVLTAALTSSPSLNHLLAALEACGAPGVGLRTTKAAPIASKAPTQTAASSPPSRRPARQLNAVQLCAALTTAERLARSTSGGEEEAVSGSGGGCGNASSLSSGRGVAASRAVPTAAGGLLAPPCRSLPPNASRALAELLAAHSEVLADADPPEMAATLWAAARLRLALPEMALEPALEAVWMWDPADPAVNRPRRNGYGVADSGAVDEAGMPRRNRGGGGHGTMGPREVCLLLYAVSVLRPEYLRHHACGFLEALESWEAAGAQQSGQPRGSIGRLSPEQVVGVVTALARAGARLDEEGQEFVLQACSSRLNAFSTAHLSALVAAAQSWSAGGGGNGGGGGELQPLQEQLLDGLLRRLAAEQHRYLQRKQVVREQQHVGQEGPPVAVLPPPEASDAVTGRALVTALRACVHTPSGGGGGSPWPRVHGSVLSGLLRQVRHRAAALNSRDVCEGLRLLADLRRGGHQKAVAAWNEGLRALLKRWVECLKQVEAQGLAPRRGTGGSGAGHSASAEARTFATTLHAVGRLGVRLKPAESEAVARAACMLAPAMRSPADCCMALTALAQGTVGQTGPHGEQEGWEEEPTSSGASGGGAASTAGGGGAGWRWLRGAGVRSLAGSGRMAARLVLEQAAAQLGYAARPQAARATDEPQHGGGSRSASPDELTCMARAAAAVGALPPQRWWDLWAAQVRAQGRGFTAAEATDVLYSLARLENLRQPRAAAGRTWRERKRFPVAPEPEAEQQPAVPLGLQAPCSPGTAAAGANLQAASRALAIPPTPVSRELLAALLAVACAPPRAAQASGAHKKDLSWSPTRLGGAPGGGSFSGPRGPGAGPAPLSTYYLTWAVWRLRLVGQAEAALWSHVLTAAVPFALPVLTARKQVLLMRSASRAFHGARLPLPPGLVEAWLVAFAGSMDGAQAGTLAYAAAAVAEAPMAPSAGWLAAFRSAVRHRAADLTVREAAALVAGLQLHHMPRQRQAREWQAHDGGDAALARSLLQVLRRKLATAPAVTAAPAVKHQARPAGQQQTVQSQQQPRAPAPAAAFMSDADRLLARRLCILLARGGAAGGRQRPAAAIASPDGSASGGAVEVESGRVGNLALAPRPMVTLRRGVEGLRRPVRLQQWPS